MSLELDVESEFDVPQISANHESRPVRYHTHDCGEYHPDETRDLREDDLRRSVTRCSVCRSIGGSS